MGGCTFCNAVSGAGCAVVSVQGEGNLSAQGSLASTLGAAAVVWAVRVGAVYCGSWLGAWLGGTPPEHRRRVWYGMITQVCTPLDALCSVPAWPPRAC